MAQYQIMYWKDIPNVVKAWDAAGEKKIQLSSRFALAIDAAAMHDADVEADAYLDGWRWADEEGRSGSAEEVASDLVQELEAAWPRERLTARTHGEMSA